MLNTVFNRNTRQYGASDNIHLNSPFLHFLCSSVVGDGLGEGYGMLGQAGSGKLRVSIGQSKLAAKVAKK